jgi:hypothetical protein
MVHFQERKNRNKEKSVALCKMRGLILEDVNELNELSETRLISAAAEGRSMTELSLLVNAGADVNGTRPDGVTAIWLAAQVNGSLITSRFFSSLMSVNTQPALEFKGYASTFVFIHNCNRPRST